ncbi:carboxypeptidase-like regulatory domain-containing protein [Dokdonia sp.]|uniref:carboxypeptidase-like regulatory domain-containing protein n=1 Tax=Dokdonia sp. TaxID=2024995 RepID=UPI003264C5A5
MRNIVLIITLLITTIAFSQRGIISGTLTEEGGPLPGASISIKGTDIGVQTDFDGNYAIACNVGDVIIISYVGYTTREFTVTQEMFSDNINPYSGIIVEPIKSAAYTDALQKNKASNNTIPSAGTTSYTYTKEKGYRSFSRIQNINTKNNVVYLTYFKPDIYIEGAIRSSVALRSIKSRNLLNTANNNFRTVFTNDHDANVSLWSQKFKSNLTASLITGRNLYNTNSNTKISIGGFYQNNNGNNRKVPLKVRVHATTNSDNLANINGFQNILLHNQFIISENNPNSTASFLRTTRSKKTQNHLTTSLIASHWISDDVSLHSNSSASFDHIEEQFNAQAGTLGFNTPYSSIKEIRSHQIQSDLSIKTDFDISDFISGDTNTNGSYRFTNLDYTFSEPNESIPLTISQDLTKQVFELKNVVSLDYDNFLFLTLSNVSYTSSIQESDWWIPQVTLAFIPTATFYGLRSDFFNYANISIRYGENTKDSPLLYGNYSHNALTITPENAILFSNRIDLFTDSDLKLEQGKGFEIAGDFRFISNRFKLSIGYSKNENANGVFPVLQGDSFILKNTANTTSHGLDIEFTSDNTRNYSGDFEWSTSISLSRKRVKVSKLLSDEQRIPISGFSTINTNLIEGESVGVIVGSAFARNEEDNIITDENGNPLISNQSQIIGDPIPDFNLGVSNTFKFDRFEFGFILDYQKGGDIWNGSQKAIQGFSGIDEGFIEDGSYLNLKSITASYEFANKKKQRESQQNALITSFKVSLYTHNIATWSAYKGATPYSSFFDGASSQGLNFFNTPIVSQTGIQIIAKL